MNDLDRNRILDRVRKCLNIAHCETAPAAERDTALRHAYAILAKYNLDLAQVESRSDAKAAESEASEPRVKHGHTFGGWPWARATAASIGDLFFCSYFYIRGRTDRQTTHCFIGRTSNAVTASLVAEFVVKSIIREAQRYARDTYQNNDAVRAFGWGAANEIHRRVAELKAAADRDVAEKPTEPAAPGTAVVLADVRLTEAKANEAFVKANFRLGTGRSSPGTHSSDARAAGRAFGAKVNLTAQIK